MASVIGYPSQSFQINHGMWQASYPGLSFIPTSFQRNVGEPNVAILERGYAYRHQYGDGNAYQNPTYSLGSSYQSARPLSSQPSAVRGSDGKVYENNRPGVSPPGMSNADASANGYSYIGGTMRNSQAGFDFQNMYYHRHCGWTGSGGNAFLNPADNGQRAMFPGIWRADWNYYVYFLRFHGNVFAGRSYDRDYFNGSTPMKQTSGKILVPAETDTGKFIYTSANGDNVLAFSEKNDFKGRDIDGEKCGPYRSVKRFSLLQPVVHPDSLGTNEVTDTSCTKSYAEDAPEEKINITINVRQASFNGIRGWMYEEHSDKISLPNLSISVASYGHPPDPHFTGEPGGHGHHGGQHDSSVIIIEEDELPDPPAGT